MTLEQFEHDECNRLKKENEELKERIAELEKSEKWIKFDPNNPDTFPLPPNDEVFIYYQNYGIAMVEVFVSSFQNVMRVEFWQDKTQFYNERVSHWKPLPKPPTETEDE